jgi:hypothetical protein
MKPLLGKPISMCLCVDLLRPKGAADDEVSQELVHAGMRNFFTDGMIDRDKFPEYRDGPKRDARKTLGPVGIRTTDL